MSPLLFPKRPYHNLVKDDKLVTEQLNNPVNDCQKARDLLMDEIAAWEAKGYVAHAAKVHFIVAWRPKDAPKEETETAVLLADIIMTLSK